MWRGYVGELCGGAVYVGELCMWGSCACVGELCGGLCGGAVWGTVCGSCVEGLCGGSCVRELQVSGLFVEVFDMLLWHVPVNVLPRLFLWFSQVKHSKCYPIQPPQEVHAVCTRVYSVAGR